MKAELLRRMAELEAAVERSIVPRTVMLEAHRFAPDDRAAYWEGDDSVLTRYGFDGDGLSSHVRAIVIDLNPECRAKWLTTVDMDDDDLEAFEQREILNEQRREQDARDQQERARLEAWREAQPRAIIGYDRAGKPVYDNDPGMVTNWGE